jgi:hypothetical protein
MAPKGPSQRHRPPLGGVLKPRPMGVVDDLTNVATRVVGQQICNTEGTWRHFFGTRPRRTGWISSRHTGAFRSSGTSVEPPSIPRAVNSGPN